MIDQQLKDELRWVEVSGNEDLSYFPDFLILGPQRTGTTWLHANLRNHPQIFLTEPKELYFFSSLKARDPRHFVSDQLQSYLRHFREPLGPRIAKTVSFLRTKRQLYWPKVRGEATASYATLDPDVIAEIVRLNPDIKAILMIRNPIERAWSHAKKDLVRNQERRIDDVPAEAFRAFFSGDYQRRCARYVEQHDNWSAALRPGHLFIGAFDEIATRPERMLLEVMSFLGVRSNERYIGPAVHRPINPTESTPIPDAHRRYLEQLFEDDLRKLRDRFGLSW